MLNNAVGGGVLVGLLVGGWGSLGPRPLQIRAGGGGEGLGAKTRKASARLGFGLFTRASRR